jgi:hypothetical protein
MASGPHFMDSLATVSSGVSALIELLAPAHDKKRNHDEKTDSCDDPDNRNVVHGGLLSEARSLQNDLRLKRNIPGML